MNDQLELEGRLRAAFGEGSLPAAPAALFTALDEAPSAPVLRSRRRQGAWPRLLALAAVLVVGGTVVASIGGPRPSPLPAPSLRPSVAAPTIGGPLRITYQPQWTADVPFDVDDLATVVAVVQGRLDAIGVTDARTTSDEQGRVIVDLPAGIDTDAIRRLVGQVGQLRFLPLENGPLEHGTVVDQTRTWAALAVNGDVTDASVDTEAPSGQPALNVELGHDAATRFAEYTAANLGSAIAITLDGIVVSSPTIMSPMPDGKIQISLGGASTSDPAELARLAAIFRFGPLPVPIMEVANGPVPPSAEPQIVCGSPLPVEGLQLECDDAIRDALAILPSGHPPISAITFFHTCHDVGVVTVPDCAVQMSGTVSVEFVDGSAPVRIAVSLGSPPTVINRRSRRPGSRARRRYARRR